MSASMGKVLAEILSEVWDDGNCTGLDGWIGPGRGSAEVDDDALRARERMLRKAAEVLAANGYGKLREARAKALEDAAEELESDAGYQSHFMPEEVTQGQLNAAEFLRARAASERGGE